MQYLTELHAHTCEVSPCGDLTAGEVADRYLAAGYSTVVISNHYTQSILESAGQTTEERVKFFLAPYYAMKEYAKDRLHVILGCELRFTGSSNDYLIFGVTESFLMEHPDLYSMNLKSFRALADENGLLIVQAHPFRNGMNVVNPQFLDGVETFNGHKGHESRNTIAQAWAKLYNLIPTSGTDFHHPHQGCDAGIFTDSPITNVRELIDVLKSRDYVLHCSGPRAEVEGITDHSAKY